jgi:hypothetical protein
MVKKRGSKRGKEGAATYHGEEVDPPDEERAGAAHLRPSPEPAGLSNGTGSGRRRRRRPGERGNGEWHLWRRAAAPVCASALAQYFCARLKATVAAAEPGRARMARAESDSDTRGRVVIRRARDQVSVGGWRERHRVLAIAACRGPAGVGAAKKACV